MESFHWFTGQECSGPWCEHLGMVSSVVRVMPTSAWVGYGSKSVLQGQPKFSSTSTQEKIIKNNKRNN